MGDKTSVVVDHGQGGRIVVESYSLQPSNDTTSSIQQSESDEFRRWSSCLMNPRRRTSSLRNLRNLISRIRQCPRFVAPHRPARRQALVIEVVALCGFPLRGWVV